MIASGDLPAALLQSLGRVFAGFAIAARIAQSRSGSRWAASRAVERNLDPLVESFRPIAAIAILPLAILWFGTGTPAALMIVAYAAFFPIVVNTIAGAKRVNPTLLAAAATMGLTRLADDSHGRRSQRAAVDRRRPAHRARRRLDGDRRRRARRRRQGRRRRLRRHRPDDVRLLRLQHRAQPHRRVHDRGRPRRAACSTACCARCCAWLMPWSAPMSAAEPPARSTQRRQALRAARAARKRSRSQDFSLDVRQGEFLVIVGPSGCGKTTVLNLLAGLQLADQRARSRSTARRSTGPGPERGVMFQDYALFPWHTVWGNVEFGLRHGPPGNGLDAAARDAARAAARSSSSASPAPRASIRTSFRAACASAWRSRG